ncbi:MAG: hypothetical protein CUN57_04065, partial [Phototrophicales bacterium]
MEYKGKGFADTDNKKNAINRPLVRVDVRKDGVMFTFTTTHFTWVGHGKIDEDTGLFVFYDEPLALEDARRDGAVLLDYLGNIDEFVFVADLQVARGTEMY